MLNYYKVDIIVGTRNTLLIFELRVIWICSGKMVPFFDENHFPYLKYFLGIVMLMK